MGYFKNMVIEAEDDLKKSALEAKKAVKEAEKAIQNMLIDVDSDLIDEGLYDPKLVNLAATLEEIYYSIQEIKAQHNFK